MGGLSKTEKLRRDLLRMVTGVGAPPDLVPPALRVRTTERLALAWDADHEGQPWMRAVEAGQATPMLFALAEYDRKAHLAAVLLDRILRNEARPEAGPYR